jgi:hypothetical protein
MSQKFQRNIEDFTCEHCGFEVKGTGYTNHCPKCLWSKHVDVFPGDRAEECGGLMEPIGLVMKKGTYVITHRCVKCGEERTNKTVPEDNIEILIS